MANGIFMRNWQSVFDGVFFIARRLSMSRLRISYTYSDLAR